MSAQRRPSPRARLPLGLSIAAAVATLLASAGLATLLSDGKWIAPVFLGVGCVISGANLSRLAGLPTWMSAPTALLALLMGLTLLYSEGNAALGIIPTPSAIAALRGQFADGVAVVASGSVPTPSEPGLVALIVASVGVIAIVVELCVVTLRRAAVAGYPLLILAVVPIIASEADLPWWTFASGAAGYVLLLAVAHIDATAHWGPQIALSEPASARSAPRRLLRRTLILQPPRPAYLIGLGGIAVAIAVSAVVPGSSGQGLFAGFDTLKHFGMAQSRSVETVHPFTSLRGELDQANPSELLRVRTNDPEPFYLRLTSLDRFTGQGWTQSRLHASEDAKVSSRQGAASLQSREPLLAASAPRVQQQTKVEVRGLTGSPFLPVYANPTKISIAGDWRWDSGTQTVFSARDRTERRSYTFDSQRVPYSQQLLDAAPPVPKASRLFQQYTALDGAVRPQLRALVHQLASAAGSQIDTVRAIEQYFDESNGFRYTERTATGSSGDALVDFLAHKQGFCEQYASAMAYLVRAAGIPARVAIGFSRGQQVSGSDNDGGYISITSRDAHAWVEVYFQNLGWVPFDPTPASGPGRTADTTYPRQPTANVSSPPPSTIASSDASAATPRPNARASSSPMENPPPSDRSGSWIDRWPTLLGLGVLALLAVTLLAGPAAFRGWERRRRLRRIHSVAGGRAELPCGHEPVSHTFAHNVLTSSALTSSAFTNAVLARAGVGAWAFDAVDAAWHELTDTAYNLRLLSVAWTQPAVVWRSQHTPRELCSQLGTHQFNEGDRDAIALIAAAQERSRYARNVGTVEDLHAAVLTASAALTSRATLPRRLAARLWPLSVGERATHTAMQWLSTQLTRTARHAVSAQKLLRHACKGAAETFSSARLRRAGGANAAPIDRSANPEM